MIWSALRAFRSFSALLPLDNSQMNLYKKRGRVSIFLVITLVIFQQFQLFIWNTFRYLLFSCLLNGFTFTRL